jgi:hypothetical protein
MCLSLHVTGEPKIPLLCAVVALFFRPPSEGEFPLPEQP